MIGVRIPIRNQVPLLIYSYFYFHMKAILPYFLAVNLTLAGCSHSSKPIPVKTLRFDGIFASPMNAKHAEYCLEWTGFFRAPIAENADSVLQKWIKQHPEAHAIPVATISQDTAATFIFCWVIDGMDTLNNYLVRTGCIPGGTMLGPGRVDLTDEKGYMRFIEQIKIDESEAKTNKLGIWNRPDSLSTKE